MEENTNQTIETQQTAETPKQNVKKSDKTANTVMIALLVLIILLLGALIGYQFLRKSGGGTIEPGKTTGQTTTQESTAPQGNIDTTGQVGQNTQTDTTTTGTTVKPDIDGDLKTLDKLDLSGIENDYGEDQLSDL